MKDLKTIESESLAAIEKAANLADLENAKVKVLGRKSDLSQVLKSLGALAVGERKKIGSASNELRKKLESALADRAEFLSLAGEKVSLEKIDVTSPGSKNPLGHIHPLVQTQRDIIEIFTSFGYTLAEGPDIETEDYNFDKLSIPADHPARDMWDTFFIKDKNMVLRTHTSPVQIRFMLKNKPPFRIFSPGRTYRYEQIDAGHTPNFYQCEGLVIDKNITLADLKGTIEEFIKRLFGPKAKIRMRQSFFPFTEPSVEVDMSCKVCDSQGCSVCKNSGWLEIMGAGMVHPNVLRNVGLDPEEWQGFAFGMGLDRICMLKYGIEDIRLLYSNNLRFLEQF